METLIMSLEDLRPGDQQSSAFPPHAVMVRGQPGYVFRSEGVAGYCFIPAECISRTPDGRVVVNEIAYLNSGWGLRNRRFSDQESDGKFVFPDASQMIIAVGSPEIRSFLQRLG